MSAKEIIAKLKVEADEGLITEFDEQLAASKEIIGLRAFSGFTSSVDIFGSGCNIHIVFQNGPSGGGSSNRYLRGSGSFAGAATPAGILGKYKLVVGAVTLQLFDENNRPVWTGTGRQNGLAGEYWVQI